MPEMKNTGQTVRRVVLMWDVRVVGCAGCGMWNEDALCFINSGAVEVEWSTEQIRRV
jgi:hypothetical protein